MAHSVSTQGSLVSPNDLENQARRLQQDRIDPMTSEVTYRFENVRYRQQQPVLRGSILTEKSLSGMVVHVIDALAMQTFCVQAQMQPALKITLFFEGNTHFEFGQASLHLPSNGQLANVLTIRDETECRMHIKEGDRRYGLYVAVTPDWFARQGLDSERLQARLNKHLTLQQWALPRHLWLHARKIIEQPELSASARLGREGFGFALIAAWLASLEESLPAKERTHSDKRQVQRFCQFLSEEESWLLSLDEIGHQLGMSAATLQRYAREHLGMSLTQYLRKQRLNRACQGLHRGQLTIMDAALLAGYNHPNNFSVAFKKQFGVSPTEVHECSLNSLLTRH